MKKWHGKYQSPFAKVPAARKYKFRYIAVDWTDHEVIAQGDDWSQVDWDASEYHNEYCLGFHDIKIYDTTNTKDLEVLTRNHI